MKVDLLPIEGRLINFFNNKRDTIDEISGLTQWVLRRDLEEAVKYNKGYYKNKKGVYRYLKGIEVTNNTGYLCRMGFNGEDRGVWVHYCEVTNRKAGYYDVPIVVFSSKFDPRFTPEDELMVSTTKEDFEEQVQKVVQNIISDYPQKRDPKEYLDMLNEWKELMEEYKKECPVGLLPYV